MEYNTIRWTAIASLQSKQAKQFTLFVQNFDKTGRWYEFFHQDKSAVFKGNIVADLSLQKGPMKSKESQELEHIVQIWAHLKI